MRGHGISGGRSPMVAVVVMLAALGATISGTRAADDGDEPTDLQTLQADVDMLLTLRGLNATREQVEQIRGILEGYNLAAAEQRQRTADALAPNAGLLQALLETVLEGKAPAEDTVSQYRDAVRPLNGMAREAAELRRDAAQRIIETFTPEQAGELADGMAPTGARAGDAMGAALRRVRQLSDEEFDRRKVDTAKSLLGPAAFGDDGQERIDKVVQALERVRGMSDDELAANQEQLLAELQELGAAGRQGWRRGGPVDLQRGPGLGDALGARRGGMDGVVRGLRTASPEDYERTREAIITRILDRQGLQGEDRERGADGLRAALDEIRNAEEADLGDTIRAASERLGGLMALNGNRGNGRMALMRGPGEPGRGPVLALAERLINSGEHGVKLLTDYAAGAAVAPM